jgi:hypothetical protein
MQFCLICCTDAEVHHVTRDVPVSAKGGMAMKTSDEYVVPLCHKHHMEGHDRGWETFEKRYWINLRKEADKLAIKSPHLKRKV